MTTSATWPESGPHDRPFGVRGRRQLLADVRAELSRLGAAVDPTHVPDEALAPRLALERERLRALRNP